jgi:hypothetical protein
VSSRYILLDVGFRVPSALERLNSTSSQRNATKINVVSSRHILLVVGFRVEGA